MDSTTLNIVLGVVSGVLTSAILLVFGRLWADTVLPMLKQWKYRGVEIEGVWRGEGGDAAVGHTEISITMNQHTLEVSGLMTVRHRSPTNSFELSFQAVGKIWEGYVTLTLTPISRSVTAVATALLKIDGGGGSLKGQMCFRNTVGDFVDVIPVFLVRAQGHQLPNPGANANANAQATAAAAAAGAAPPLPGGGGPQP